MNWIQFSLGAVFSLVFSFMAHLIDVNHLEKKHQKALSTQQAKLEGACKDDQKLTKGKNDGLQKDLDDIKHKLTDSKRVQPSRCIVISAPAGNPNLAVIPGKHAGQDGVSADWFRDYGAECESIRQTMMSCTGFVNDVWKSRGQ